MNKEKLTKIKNRFKQEIADHSAELLIFGVSALALTGFAFAITKATKIVAVVLKNEHGIDTGVEIVNSNGEAFLAMSAEALKKMLEGTSDLCFEVADNHFSLTKIADCTKTH